MRGRKVISLFSLIIAAGMFLVFSFVSLSSAVPTHLDKSKVKKGCSECHKGHGKAGTPLLAQSKDDFCFGCHSSSGNAPDIYSEVLKSSRHPVLDTGRYHMTGETLPERDPSRPRHVSCYDCHNIHKSEKGKPIEGLRGYSGRGAPLKHVKNEYELCYRCHSDSVNLSSDELNISFDFSVSNASYHPVETQGRSRFVPSLKKKMGPSSTITCSDCHGSDNQFGPQGPHGSIYEPILKFRYNRLPGSESQDTYRLCYECHDRTSILSDASFKAHKLHIVYNQASCAQCHDSHGSRLYSALIEFDMNNVFPNSTGELNYMSAIQGRPRCFLSCHVSGQPAEHRMDKNFIYCVNDNCFPQW